MIFKIPKCLTCRIDLVQILTHAVSLNELQYTLQQYSLTKLWNCFIRDAIYC